MFVNMYLQYTRPMHMQNFTVNGWVITERKGDKQNNF